MHEQQTYSEKFTGVTPSAHHPAATAEPNPVYGPEGVSTRRPRDAAEKRAVALGWFSLGLGLAQVIAPRQLARTIGVADNRTTELTLRAFGVREIASGVGILLQPRPNTFLWARVLGDLIDLAALTEQLVRTRSKKPRLALATAAVVGTTALDIKTALDATRARAGQNMSAHGIHVKHSITIQAAPEDVYAYWRNLENLPRFLSHLESVQVFGSRSVWRAKAPAGTTVEWEAELLADTPNSLISWRSLPGSTIPNQGSVRFKPAPKGQGTEVHVQLVYSPPGGVIGSLVAKLFGEEPKQQIKSDLRRLKQVLETGEVLHSDTSIHRRPHPAQPPSRVTVDPDERIRPLHRLDPANQLARSARGSASSDASLTGVSSRSNASAAPPKPPRPAQPTHGSIAEADDQRTAASDAPNDAIPFTHFTNQGFGTTRDDDAS